MSLSVAEKSFLYDSLSSSDCIRPDGRLPHQFRPLEVYTDFLPSSNGSSRIIASDGSECIASIKAKVVDHQIEQELLKVEVDIAGQRDDSSEVETLSSLLNRVLMSEGSSIDISKLRLTRKYSFKLFIDVLIISSSSHPISLISFTIFSALTSTYLPKIISNFDDLEVEELPTFHDSDLVKLDVTPPLIFVLAIIRNNVFMDAAANESEVADNGLIVTWSRGKIVAPLRTVALNNSEVRGFNPCVLQKSIEMAQRYAEDIMNALK